MKRKSFDEKLCIIPEIWCGDSPVPPKKKDKKYYKNGSRYECLRKGIGVGMFKDKVLSSNSLQNIKYVGDKYEQNFKNYGISNINQLIKKINELSSKGISTFLKNVFKKSDGTLDKRAYNSTLLYLYRIPGGSNKVNTELPSCIKIKV